MVFDKNIFARRMHERRVTLGIGVRELARRLDCAPSLITQYEDATTTPGLSLLVALATVLEVSTDWLLGIADASSTGGDDLD